MSFIARIASIFAKPIVAATSFLGNDLDRAFMDAEALLVARYGDAARKLCEDAASTSLRGIEKLGQVVADLIGLAAADGIRADATVLTTVAQKAYAQIRANAAAEIAALIAALR